MNFIMEFIVKRLIAYVKNLYYSIMIEKKKEEIKVIREEVKSEKIKSDRIERDFLSKYKQFKRDARKEDK